MEKTDLKYATVNASIIGLTALGGAAIGFVLQLIIAYYFGAGQDTDAFFMAQSASELLSKLLLGGSIVSVFIPLFIEEATRQNRASAWRTALTVIHLLAAAYLVLIVVVGLFAPTFVQLIAPGFSIELRETTTQLLRVMLPAFFALFLVELGTSILQAVKHFIIPASLRIVAPATSVVVTALLAPHIGIYALAYSVLIGAILQVALIGYALSQQGFRYQFRWQPDAPIIKKLLQLVYPFIFSMLVTQGAAIVYRVLVSDLQSGSLSALKFAEKITQLLTVIFLTSFTTVIYPTLSERAAKHGASSIKPALASASRLIFFVSIPIVAATIVLREPLITLLFERGSFTAEDTVATSIALMYLTFGLLTNGISALFGYATLALQKTKAAVAITALSQGVAIILFFYLTPRLGHAGLALASSLVPIAITGMYVWYLSRFIPGLVGVFWHKTYAIAIALGAILVIVMTQTHAYVTNLPVPPKVSLGMQIIIPVLVGGLVYGWGAYFLRVSEVRQATQIAWAKIRKFTHTL